MADKKNNNKLITIILAIVIIISAITLIYISLPKDNSKKTSNENQNSQQNESEIILTLKFENEELNYSLEDLENLETYTDDATMIKTKRLPTVITEGPNEYTGVKISTLLNEIENLPENYIINITSTDGYITNFNLSQIQGNVNIYNESGVIIDNSSAIMVLAYKIDGEYFTQNDTLPLRIVFCNENMTSSSLWAKMVNTIEIIEQ